MSGAIGGPFVNPSIPGGGQNMPPIGIGPRPGSTILDQSSIKSAILQAIRLGYRHLQITISSFLEHQAATKEAIVEALERGVVNSRDELFITCKIEHHDAGFGDNIIRDLKKFLETMQLEYVDLCLVQWHDHDELKRLDDWAAMEECHRLGLTKSIGVCNLPCEMLKYMLKNAKIPPSVNQVGIDKLLKEKELREFCSANKISIIASSTIGEKGKDLDLAQFMELESLKKIAKDGQKTADQVVFRWAYEQGVSLLLESLSKEHMQEILSTLEWSSPQDDK